MEFQIICQLFGFVEVIWTFNRSRSITRSLQKLNLVCGKSANRSVAKVSGWWGPAPPQLGRSPASWRPTSSGCREQVPCRAPWRRRRWRSISCQTGTCTSRLWCPMCPSRSWKHSLSQPPHPGCEGPHPGTGTSRTVSPAARSESAPTSWAALLPPGGAEWPWPPLAAGATMTCCWLLSLNWHYAGCCPLAKLALVLAQSCSCHQCLVGHGFTGRVGVDSRQLWWQRLEVSRVDKSFGDRGQRCWKWTRILLTEVRWWGDRRQKPHHPVVNERRWSLKGARKELRRGPVDKAFSDRGSEILTSLTTTSSFSCTWTKVELF